MKNIFIFLIKLYQKIPGPWHNSCRHIPTCSNYALEALKKYGTIIGLKLTIKRIIKCNPWGTYGYDPVPKIKEKKMKKKILILLTLLLLSTGCFKRDMMEDINIISTIYPIEYITNRLYGENSTIKNVYPRGADIETYKITKKEIKDYSSKDLFVYNGESEEREIAKELLKINKNLKIIDATYGTDNTYGSKNIWLNPSNILMIAQNIRNELGIYITNAYLIEEINNQYELLKVDISELETEIKKIADNSNDKRIISFDESLKFLEKYGFTIINLTENNELKENNILLAKDLLANKKLTQVFVTENTKHETIEDLKNNYDATITTFNPISTITEDELKNNDDYLSIMYKNLELIKTETYK